MFAANEAAETLGTDVPAIFSEALKILSADFTPQTAQALESIVPKREAPTPPAPPTPKGPSPPPTKPPSSPIMSTGPSLPTHEERLGRIKNLQAGGLITDNDNDAKRQSILDEI